MEFEDRRDPDISGGVIHRVQGTFDEVCPHIYQSGARYLMALPGPTDTNVKSSHTFMNVEYSSFWSEGHSYSYSGHYLH